jgi:hypothetical protein
MLSVGERDLFKSGALESVQVGQRANVTRAGQTVTVGQNGHGFILIFTSRIGKLTRLAISSR